MRKLFMTDFKRLLQSRTSIIITILAPLILVVLISLTIAPLYFSDVRLDYFHITVLNEDADPSTKLIADSLIKSDTLKGLYRCKVRGYERRRASIRWRREASLSYTYRRGCRIRFITATRSS